MNHQNFTLEGTIKNMSGNPGILGIFSIAQSHIFAILSNHKIHHIYLNLAVLLSYNQNCMMYYMRLCNAEYSQNPRVPTHIFYGAL